MIRPWTYLESPDRDTFRAVIAFLHKRMTEQDTLDWALNLKLDRKVERTAITYLLNAPDARNFSEPWATAWQLVEESWSSDAPENDDGTAIYSIQKRLRAGDRSGSVVAAIVKLVAPRLKVEPIDSWRWQFVKKRRKPRSFAHVLTASLTSGNLIDLKVLELANFTDVHFLKSLANALEAAIQHGFDIARRLGWDGQWSLWQLGELQRIYYVPSSSQSRRSEDPDAYHQGIAPAVKLLHAVVARISDIDLGSVQQFMLRWSLDNSPVYVRLCAAMSRNSQVAAADKVGAFLIKIDDRKFWDVHHFPEIAELRAVRFSDLEQNTQQVIARRLVKGPPRKHWPKNANSAKVKNARLYWAVRELRRIEVAGGKLPADAKSWLSARIAQFSEFDAMSVDEGFPVGVTVSSVPRNPDHRFNTLQGETRLHALETALSTGRSGWGEAPADRASDWLQQPDKLALILDDIESTSNAGDDFPSVWNQLGWAHSPSHLETTSATPSDFQGEAERVLALLNRLSKGTLSAAIEGICAWLAAWKKQIVASPLGSAVWLRVWPIAVEATNSRSEGNDDADLTVIAHTVDADRDPTDLDTLNPPVGKLVSVFLAACPTLAPGSTAFAVGSTERRLRDAVIASNRRSGLISRHRLIEELPYFLRADPDWTQEHLVVPLQSHDGASLALWRAIARRTHFTDVLKVIGGAMADRATDRRLSRETRRGLVFSIVIESLHAFREGRDPAVPNSRVQQVLRTLDDEVRASAANAVQQFLRELSAKTPKRSRLESEHLQRSASAAALFRSSAAPFLRYVWPQERSLSTPGVSSALADLPATSGEAFAEAVDAIERFLVPFECWSMLNYGLYGEDGDSKKIAIINSESKARALLRLLDLTIGTAESAVIPYDLTDALDQIESVAPSLADSAAFRRLSTSARR